MTEVFLHVYDVANSESVKTNNAILQLNKIFKDGIGLGGIFHSAIEVKEILMELSLEWQGSSYDLLSRNCNHFCNDFCTRLEVQKIPGWVNRFANAGETAVDVAETTMKRLRQAKTEVVSASKSAYRVLFGGASASAVSPDPGLVEGSGSSSNGGGNLLRLSFMKTPVSLFSKIGLGSASQSFNERVQGDESTSNKNGGVHVHSGDMRAPEQPL